MDDGNFSDNRDPAQQTREYLERHSLDCNRIFRNHPVTDVHGLRRTPWFSACLYLVRVVLSMHFSKHAPPVQVVILIAYAMGIVNIVVVVALICAVLQQAASPQHTHQTIPIQDTHRPPQPAPLKGNFPQAGFFLLFITVVGATMLGPVLDPNRFDYTIPQVPILFLIKGVSEMLNAIGVALGDRSGVLVKGLLLVALLYGVLGWHRNQNISEYADMEPWQSPLNAFAQPQEVLPPHGHELAPPPAQQGGGNWMVGVWLFSTILAVLMVGHVTMPGLILTSVPEMLIMVNLVRVVMWAAGGCKGVPVVGVSLVMGVILESSPAATLFLLLGAVWGRFGTFLDSV